ncbi:MAG: protein-glutamate O-methyltransferase CheR [Methylocystis sp.]
MRNSSMGRPREGAPVSDIDEARARFAFARFRRQWAALTGVVIGADKQPLVERRLASVMRAHDIVDFLELTQAIDRRENDALIEEAIDAMTTNQTSFFRDRAPFEAFRARILPELMAARERERRLRIWCAAVSTGQEAYSLAMTLDEAARELRGWSLEILGTDISGAAIETARKGVYSHFEVQQGLSTTHLLRYFHREEECWRVNDHLRARVAFGQFNLLSNPMDLGPFDVILCRNAVTHFGQDAKRDVLERLARLLAEDGYLFLGDADTVDEAASCFVPTSHRSVWRRRARPRPKLALA